MDGRAELLSTLDDQIATGERENKLRRPVYLRRVANAQMTQRPWESLAEADDKQHQEFAAIRFARLTHYCFSDS